jgi:hypothetical protein
MAVNKKSLENLDRRKQFSPVYQPANSGRRPDVFAKYIRENHVSMNDMRALISSLFGYTAEEITAILKDKKEKPAVALLLMLKSLKKDIGTGSIGNLLLLMDRAYGKPEKTINHEIGAIDPKTLSVLTAAFRDTE